MFVGADISKAMIDHAGQKYQSEKRLSFLQLDIETSVLPNEQLEQYSNVLSFYCLHWCQDPRYCLTILYAAILYQLLTSHVVRFRRAFDNIYKLLQPEGKALVMFLAWNDGFDAYMRVYENPRYKPYMQVSHVC